jgi:hypothetical protein
MKIKLPQTDGVVRVTVTLSSDVTRFDTVAEAGLLDLPLSEEEESQAHILIQTLGANGQPNGIFAMVLQEPETAPKTCDGSYFAGTTNDVAVHEVALEPAQIRTLSGKK